MRRASAEGQRPPVGRLVVASPRGYCAGVEHAVRTVERALLRFGPPIYVRRPIVHDSGVLRDLERRGAVFVSSEADVPAGATVVFSAHGVSPAVYGRALQRGLRIVDATCPLVARAHAEARRYAAKGYSIILVGDANHEEVEGTAGVAPEATFVVESVDDARAVSPAHPERLAYLTQTTLSLEETSAAVDVLRRRFPRIEAPRREDVCYATTNRQRAVVELLDEIDLLLVVGSHGSTSSNRLVELGRTGGVDAYLIGDESAIEHAWLSNVESVGLTSGESTPESLVRRVIAWFTARGVEEIRFNGAQTQDHALQPGERSIPMIRC